MKVVLAATNVAELLRRQAVRNGARTALIDGDRRVTWSQLDGRVDELARGLSELGAVAGDRVAISMVNRIEFVASYLGALRGGRVAVPIHPTSTPGAVARVLADSASRWCFADAASVEVVREAASCRTEAPVGSGGDRLARTWPPTLIVVDAPVQTGELGYGDVTAVGAEVMSPRDAEAVGLLLYSCGTHGRPRAAMLSHRALLANIDQASRIRPAPMRPDDIVLGAVPLSSSYGLNTVLGQVLLQGSTLVLGKWFDPEEMAQLVSTEGVTCVPVAPPVVAAWARRDDVAAKLAPVRTLLVGAAWLAVDVVREFEQRTGVTVHQGYGVAEAGPVVTSTLESPERKPGSVGRPVPGVELRIVDDTGSDVRGDAPGEIWVRGRNLFSGYWPDGQGAPGPDGWLATGDGGVVDADGDLFLVDSEGMT